MNENVLCVPPKDFKQACERVLNFLHARLGLGLWMVTRTEGEDWIVLTARDYAGYGIEEGDTFSWADSFCSRMVRDEGPRITADSDSVLAYAQAGIHEKFPIRAYVGVPIMDADGELFGTLCAIDPSTQPTRIVEELPLVELLAGLLSGMLSTEMKLNAQLKLNAHLRKPLV